MRVQQGANQPMPALARVGMVSVRCVRFALLDEAQHIRLGFFRFLTFRILFLGIRAGFISPRRFGGRLGLFFPVNLNLPFQFDNLLFQPGVQNRHSALAKGITLRLIPFVFQFRKQLLRVVWTLLWSGFRSDRRQCPVNRTLRSLLRRI